MRQKVSRSPLKGKPLRVPGQSVQDALVDLVFRRLLVPLWAASIFFVLMVVEWMATAGRWPRVPGVYAILATIAGTVCGLQFWRTRRTIDQFHLGRDGERLVGEYLERLRLRLRLRGDGTEVFHDVRSDSGNLDHVVLSPRGFYVIETKTISKRGPRPLVTMTAESVLVDGYRPDRDPVSQVQTGCRWLTQFLAANTGRHFRVRGVVLFPGRAVKLMSAEWLGRDDLPWVLSPRALRKFIYAQRLQVSADDVKFAAAQLSKYIRAKQEELAKA